MLGILCVLATFAWPTTADAYIYSPPWADALYAHWPGAGGLDTTSAANDFRDRLQGPYHAFSTNPSSANSSMGTAYAQSDAVWLMAGHGNTGYITTYNSTSGSGSVLNTSLSVPGSPSCTSPNACLTSYTSSQMHYIRLMVFEGCDSGATLSNGDSLPKRAHDNLGVDFSIGFSGLIYFPAGTTWANEFGYDAMSTPDPIYQAAWDAANYVSLVYGNYEGFDTLVTYGSSSLYLHPAAYGS